MSGNREQQEFKLQNGFPGGDLRNFTVKGEEWGNPGITLNKNTYTTEISVSDQVQTSGCSFVCGQDYFCRNVIQRQCMPTRREVCDIGRRNCHFVNDVVCQDISMRVCGYETRFCSGTETYTEHYSTTEDRQDFKLIDETTSEQMGLFRDLEASHSNSYRVNTLRSCR